MQRRIVVGGLLIWLLTGAFMVGSQTPVDQIGKGSIVQINFSLDGKLFAVATSKGTWLYMYNGVDIKEVGLLKHPGWTSAVAFNPDGKFLADGGFDGVIRLWDIASKKEVATLEGHTDVVREVIFSPNGKLLISVSDDKTIRLWDVTSRKQITLLNEMSVSTAELSPNGKLLALGLDEGIFLWDVVLQQGAGILKGQGEVSSIEFGSDIKGERLISGNKNGTIRIWDIGSKKEIAVLTGHRDGICTLAPSLDGKLLASGSWDDTIRFWDIASQKEIALLERNGDWPIALKLFASNKKFLSTGDIYSRFHLWDTIRHQKVAGFEKLIQEYIPSISSITFSPDGKLLGLADCYGILHIWDVSSQKEVTIVKGDTKGEYGPFYHPIFSPSGNCLVLASTSDRTIQLWDVRSWKQTGVFKEPSFSRCISFSPDGNLLALGCRIQGDEGGTVSLWDVALQKEVGRLKGHPNQVGPVTFSPDGKLLAAGTTTLGALETRPSVIYLWDMVSQKQIAVFWAEGAMETTSLAFSPDGKLLASGNFNHTIWIWDVLSRKEIAVLTGHTGPVVSISFSPDGNLLASGCFGDNTVRLWDVDLKKEIAVLTEHNSDVVSVTFTPDGKLASASWDGTALIWDIKDLVKSVEVEGKLPITWGRIKEDKLFQNYPNPFNPETWIPYQLAENAEVDIKIYSAEGMLVRRLELGRQSAGFYTSRAKAAYWDGKNETGEKVSSGIYFYTIKAGDFTATKKLVIAK